MKNIKKVTAVLGQIVQADANDEKRQKLQEILDAPGGALTPAQVKKIRARSDLYGLDQDHAKAAALITLISEL